MANAGFASADQEQDGDALRGGNRGKRRGNLSGNVWKGWVFYIHKLEYII
jgi:hypothetical protein